MIRVADDADIPPLVTCHAACFPHDPWDAQRLLTPGAQIWCDEAHRGFTMIRTVLDEAEVISVAVNPAHQKQGLGKALLSAAMADLKVQAITHVFLDVAADNVAALALYQGLGFIAVGSRVGYYQRGPLSIDALVFRFDFW